MSFINFPLALGFLVSGYTATDNCRPFTVSRLIWATSCFQINCHNSNNNNNNNNNTFKNNKSNINEQWVVM